MQKLLESYGILIQENIKDTNVEINENTITIHNSKISEIDLNILEQKQINKITITNCEIDCIYFANDNNIELFFSDCVFKNQIIARGFNFYRKVSFIQCVFEKKIDFSGIIFGSQVNFYLTKFESEARFIQTKFLAEYTNQENIENNFMEVVFKGKTSFTRAEFKARVDFGIARFEGEARFIQTKFLAEYTNQENIENNFREAVFKGKTSFDSAEFKARVDFSIALFEGEARFTETKFLAEYTNQENIENNFMEVVFKGKTSFTRAEFKARVDFGIARFEGEARFIQTKFLAEYTNQENIENNFREAVFKGKTSFDSAEFKARVDFSIALFEGEARFINTSFFKNTIIFSEVEFNNIKFISDKERDKTITNNTTKQIYHFQDITFKGITNFGNIHIEYLNFKNVIFNNIVVFDNATLDNKPKFINCTFSNQFNIVHNYIQYNHEEIEIEKEIEKEKNNYDEFLNIRNLFRKLKSNRIAHHNLIDASELRAQELYARELELKYKENKNLKDTIEQWQLFFYRKLCDHHTDLVLNIKWLIISIGMFACMLFMVKLYKYGLSILNIFNFYGLYLSALGSFILSTLALFRCIDKMKAFVSINAIIIFWVICYKPKLIFGIANLIGDNSYNAFENLLITLYTLIAGLIIFSLQKTARKNTIIPN
ncbi:pentapeptide repeat-containing protein [Campylobacter lari]|nr:pentapeptide repeat-containing protein [Campylobacter lari]